ncbi:hypothetical protein Tco_1219321 [Tanacetum coccineum]
MDLEAIDASSQQKPKQMDEEFTTTAYPNIQENLKLPTEDQVILEEPASSTGTLSSLQNLEKDLSFTDYQAVDTIVTDAVEWAMQAPLRAHFRDLPTVDMKEILQQRMFEDNSYKAYEEEACKKKRKKHAAPRTPSGSPPSLRPPPPPPAGASGTLGISGASGSFQLPPPPLPPSTGILGSAQQQDDSIPDKQVHLSDNEDSENDHLPKADSRQDWWKPLPEEERPATPEPTWTIPSSNVDWTNLEGDHVRIDVNRPLPLGGPPGHVTIQPQFFFNKDLEYLRYGSKGSNPALSISKMKAASYPDFGLELLVPEQMWIDDVCTYDISAKYGISHWWFNRQKFYIDRHDSPSRRKDVRTHMRILSVVRIKAYSRYGYDYLSEIVLRRADFQEHTIAEKDFKNLYPSDFEDLNLLLLQGHLDHLPGSDKRMLSTAVKQWTQNLVIRQRVEDFQLGIESYQTQLNLTKPGWDATGYEFKHDYTIIEFPRAVCFHTNITESRNSSSSGQSGYKYAILDGKGRDKEQRVHSGN